MKFTRLNPWTCTLLLLYTLAKECPADSDVMTSGTVQVRLGDSASLSCWAKDGVVVVQSQWSRCHEHTILIFNAERGFHLKNKSYEGRVSMQNHSLTLMRVQGEDFGPYCCTLTTYPSGSLEGRVLLLQDQTEDPLMTFPGASNTTTLPPSTAGLSVKLMVYVAGGAGVLLVLVGIVSCLVCRKRRWKLRNPVYIQTQTVARPSHLPAQTDQAGDPVAMCDVADDDGMYLNVPDSSPDHPQQTPANH